MYGGFETIISKELSLISTERSSKTLPAKKETETWFNNPFFLDKSIASWDNSTPKTIGYIRFLANDIDIHPVPEHKSKTLRLELG